MNELLADAAGLALVSFTSGVLTAKSFARRNRYEINANQELIAFGACNIASGASCFASLRQNTEKVFHRRCG